MKGAECCPTGSPGVGVCLLSPVAAELQLRGDAELDPDPWQQHHRQLGQPDLDEVQAANNSTGCTHGKPLLWLSSCSHRGTHSPTATSAGGTSVVSKRHELQDERVCS